ncbi:MAG: DUF4139 domain-containing protein [bacterium]
MKSLFISVILFPAFCFAQEAKRESIALTVYNNDLGVVRDVRSFDLTKGQSQIRLVDVPAQIDATSVKITALKHPQNFEVLEQNFEYDLISQEKILNKFIDKPITLTNDKGERIEGTLLASQHLQVSLSSPSGILLIPNISQYRISVPNLPGGLITRPTLLWDVTSSTTLSNEPLEVLYQTSGISWHAEYIASLSDDEKSIDLTGWASIDNKCGATFENARVKLVAGDVNAVTPQPTIRRKTFAMMAADETASVQERILAEYHLYDLGRSTTIKDNEIKQLSLLNASNITATKHYTYHGDKNVEVTYDVMNSTTNNLGMPLPAGTIRMMKKDKDGTSQFIGEDRITHTPRDEKITIKTGNAFDLLGERTVTESKNNEHSTRQTIVLLVKNRKKESVTIDAIENVGGNAEIIKSSMEYEKKNANEIIFHVPVSAGSVQKVEFTVLQTW